jgi:hypothetical protein
LQRRQQLGKRAEIHRHCQAFILLSCEPAGGDEVETGVVEDVREPVAQAGPVGIARTGQQ